MKISGEARLFTIGHSTYSSEKFLSLIQSQNITAIADVRSRPYSRFSPHFNQNNLAKSLRTAQIHYVFLGLELGARRTEPECYVNGKARYDLIAKLPMFKQGLDRIRRGIKSFRVALLCAEKDPLACHRTILVTRHLRNDAGPVIHILGEDELEFQEDAETRLLQLCGMQAEDLFRSRDELIENAYDIQGERIAFSLQPEDSVEDSI
ncbi:DUF488 domain-containing protein [Zavarzinella formosa]|uniref:DUF488 domain-containing protein n=1 Tax=Zavarzinella formosa TaxID=360055 RepID=UPI00036BDABB|nr:DUF488 domain-containing protein [Zavarzinella formosa]